MMLVDAAAVARDKTTILQYAPELEKLARRDDHQPYLAIAHRAFGVAHRLVAEFEEAEIRLKRALKIFELLDMAWQKGRTLYELGELYQTREDNSLAREMFTQALAEFERLDAKPDITKVKVALGIYVQ